jgi:adenosylmethionine-8-amino-7-oxononanoate aminotransferase
MVCVDLVDPDGSGRPLEPKRVADLDREAWNRGAIVYARGSVLRLAPPLCITNEETDQLVSVVADSVRALSKSIGG